MFKRIKVITLLISVLLCARHHAADLRWAFSLMHSNNDKENFTVSRFPARTSREFTDARISLNRARVSPQPRHAAPAKQHGVAD